MKPPSSGTTSTLRPRRGGLGRAGVDLRTDREDRPLGAHRPAQHLETVEDEVGAADQQHGVLVAERLALHAVADDDRPAAARRDGADLDRGREAGAAATGEPAVGDGLRGGRPGRAGAGLRRGPGASSRRRVGSGCWGAHAALRG